MPEWPRETIANCLDRAGGAGVPSVQARAYKTSGLYPIVDQGKGLIAGWTDDAAGLIPGNPPLVVFGDHTRAFKYVDFPFVRGADGTQLLKPKEGIDPLFFYYACQTVDLPNRGYNRHFGALKEKEIPLPLIEEQLGIAHGLRLLEKAIAIQVDEVRSSEALKRMVMRALFTRGLRGEPQKETEIGLMPESWELSRLGNCIEHPDYGFTASASVEPVGPQFLRITDIQDGQVDWRKVPYCKCDEGSLEAKRLRKDDIVVARIGATTGKAFLIGECPDAVFASYLIRLRAREQSLAATFLYYFMRSDAYWLHIEQHKGGRLKGGVNIPILTALLLPRPSLDEQLEIVAILDAIDRKIDLHKRKRAVLEDLFKTLLHKLMTGEIRVSDLDLSALSPNGSEPAAA